MYPSTTIAVLLLAQLFAVSSYAGDDYKCVIEKRVAESDGAESVKRMNDNYYIGKQFTVERATGIMAGILKNSHVTKPIVIDYGAEKDNSYKVIASMRVDQGTGAGSNIYALVIDEFEPGPKKRFTFLQNS